MRDAAKMRISGLACAALLVALMALGGCGGSGQQAPSSSSSSASMSESSSSSEASSSSSSAAESADLVIGDESLAENSVELVNDTGAAIDAFFILPAGSEDDYQALLAESSEWAGEVWSDEDVAAFYFDTIAEGYDARFGVGDAVYTLHNLPLEAIETANVRLEGDVAYVTYEQAGKAVSTLQDELDVAAAEAAAAEAAAAEAAQEAAVEEVYYDETPAPAQPTQSQDSCIDGGVVLR